MVLAFTAKAMTHILGASAVSEHLHAALPALIVVTAAAAVGRVSSALSSYADGRITPLLMTEADVALVSAVCRVEASRQAHHRHPARRQGPCPVGQHRPGRHPS
jgi:ATP-binding cassette subfamily B protein